MWMTMLFVGVFALPGAFAQRFHPTSSASHRDPFFSFRGWETQVEGLWCERYGGGPHWYKNPFYLSYLDAVLKEAPRYGANALILMGRHNYAEIHTFISYRRWPRLHEIYESRNRADRELQVKRLNELIEKARRHGVAVYIWDHEIHIPPELPVLYPSVKGEDAPFCPSSSEFWRFIRDKYEEFLERVPGIAGVFLVFSETQTMLLDGSPCRCKRCRRSTPEELLEKLIRTIYGPLNKRGKRLVIRTFGHTVAHISRIVDAINELPPDLDIAVMSKSTPCDFYGFHYPLNPAIGAIRGRPHFLEEAFGEFRGKTHIVCVPARFYSEQIRHAAQNGLTGVVVRLDHNGYPRSNFETPNRFNIFFVSKLWQDPFADIDSVWHEWFTRRYSEEAAEYLIPAFKRTEDIWEKSTNALGFYVTSAHGNLAPLFRGPYNAWDNLTHSVKYIMKGFPEKEALGEELLHPTDETLKRLQDEIAVANGLADEALELVEKATPYLSPEDGEELLHYFHLGREVARLFSELKLLFFLALQAENSIGEKREGKITAAREASRRAIQGAITIEKLFGRDHWPIIPDDGRGAPFYDIIVDCWTGCLLELVLNGKLPRGGWQHKLSPTSELARLYGLLLNASRPGTHLPVQETLTLEGKFKEVIFAGRDVIVTLEDGKKIALPLAVTVSGDKLWGGVRYEISVTKGAERLRITAKPKPDINRDLRAYQEGRAEICRKTLRSIRTPADLNAYKRLVRERFKTILGPFPERTPLNPVVTGVVEREEYRIEKIIIESQPGFYVPINLYIPKGRPMPLPVVLSPLGHAPRGKSHAEKDNYQARFIALARKGYIVCAYDPLGQGEREPYGAKTGNDHYVQGYQCMPSGRHLAFYFIWDGIRCLDYLETRPEVDHGRIACAGCSGGGAITNYLAALDDRIAVAVPTSWIAESTFLTFDSEGLHPESWLLDICHPYGPGTHQLLACIAPRPLLIIGNDDDPLFPPHSMRAVYEDIKNLYKTLGVEERVEYVSVPTEHGFWLEARRELYRFLNRWFNKEEENTDELPFEVESEETLFCAPGGQVRNLPGAQTVFTINHRVMRELRSERVKRREKLSLPEYRRFIERSVMKIVNFEGEAKMVRVQEIGKRRFLCEYESGFFTIATLYHPKEATAMGIVVIGGDNDRAAKFAQRLAAEGFHTLQLQTQETQVRYEIMCGKPRCGRWAKLALCGAEFLRQQLGKATVILGIGRVSAWAVQFAGILGRDRLAAVCAVEPLDRLESLSEGIGEMDPLQGMLPATLRWLDEADLPAALAPIPVMLADIRKKDGTPLTEAEAEERYKWSRKVYGNLNRQGRLDLHIGSCSPETVARWLRTAVPAKQGRDRMTEPPGRFVGLKPEEVKPARIFGDDEPVVGTFFFYWYDYPSKAHFVNYDGTDALVDHPIEPEKVSYRSKEWWRKELLDVMDAGIDFIAPVYWGVPGHPESWSFKGLPPLVRAWEEIRSEGKHPPQIALFYDTSTLRHNPDGVHVDLRTEEGKRWFYATVRDFFSLIPPKCWMMRRGGPVIFLYSAAFAAGQDPEAISYLKRRFEEDFACQPFVVKEVSWQGEADAVYAWGGALRPQIHTVASIGPGYDHHAVPGRKPLVVDREGGNFYRRAWELVLSIEPESRPKIVMIETWNELHEGTDICETKEYGRQYIEITRRYAELFKKAP
jgi:hypothetical protein